MTAKKTTKKATNGTAKLEAELAKSKAETDRMRELALAVEKDANQKLAQLQAERDAAQRKLSAVAAVLGL